MGQSPSSKLDIWNFKGTNSNAIEKQLFSVAAPQFSIDSKLINTFYPPSGHQDEGRILPHIVFSDPHVPWLRRPGNTSPRFAASKDGRSMVPWMAVVVFETEELTVQPDEAVTIGLSGVSSYSPQKLPANGAFSMTVGDYLSKIPSNRVNYEAGYDNPKSQDDFDALKQSTDMTSIIFPTKSRIKQIFGSEDQLESLKVLPCIPVRIVVTDVSSIFPM